MPLLFISLPIYPLTYRLISLQGLYIEDRTENGSKVDPDEYFIGFSFDIVQAELLQVDWGVENTETFTSVSKKNTKKYLAKYINNMGRSEKTEKRSVSTISKTFIVEIFAFYFAVGSVEYSAALKYGINFHAKKYRGYTDHAVKATNTNLCVLVWDDKFDSLVSGGDFLKAICQTGLEIAEKVADDAQDCPKRILWCTYKWKGLGSRFVSHFRERKKRWRHSSQLCVVKDGNPGSNPVVDDIAVAIVANLLEYAFDCANSVLALVNSPQSFRLSSTPEESADGDVDSDDEVGKTCDMLESTDVCCQWLYSEGWWR